MDINFLLKSDAIPTVLCMKDIIENQLYISLQYLTVTHNVKTLQLRLDDNFLVYRWAVYDVSYVTYTEEDLI